MSWNCDYVPPEVRVLVIDDDADFRQSMTFMLQPASNAVLAVCDVHSLLALRPRPDDVLFVDLVMPSQDGIQVLGELARHRVRSRIILMSGRSADVLRLAARIGISLGLRIGGTLKKPFRLKQLHKYIAPTGRNAGDRLPESPMQPIMAVDLRQGLKNGELEIVLQPIVDIESGEPRAFEALARWRSKRYGMVYPNRFLPVAADAGLMGELAETVTRLAVEQSARLEAGGHPSVVSVNYDGADLSEASLPEKLMRLVEEFDISPEALVIELTESRAAGDQVAMMENLARLRIQGFGLAIDDFGTAYSSLDRIRNLPFSILKIDRSFVSDVETDVRARGIVAACISLARRFKLTTIAEGVETRGQLETMKRMGCEMAQGYLLAKPMPAADLLHWLETREVWHVSRSVASRRQAMAGSMILPVG